MAINQMFYNILNFIETLHRIPLSPLYILFFNRLLINGTEIGTSFYLLNSFMAFFFAESEISI